MSCLPVSTPTRRLNAGGVPVVDVPAKLAAWVRSLDSGHGRKTDPAVPAVTKVRDRRRADAARV